MTPPDPFPWRQLDYLPSKPEGVPYGFLEPGTIRQPPKLIPCDREKLEHIIASRPDVRLVATPDHDVLVPPAMVEDAGVALDQRDRRQRRKWSRFAALSFLVWGGVLAAMFFGEQSRDSRTVKFFFIIWIGLGVLPLGQVVAAKLRERRLIRNMTPSAFVSTARKDRALFAEWLRAAPAKFSRALSVALILTFAVQLAVGLPVSVERAGLEGAAVAAGQWQRLLSFSSLHGGVIHLVFNVLVLMSLGRITEAFSGLRATAFVYAISTAAAAAGSLAYLPEGVVSVGASGGILGLAGYIVVVSHRERRRLPVNFARALVPGLIAIAATGLFAYDLIDNGAHFAGFAAGCLAGAVSGPEALGARQPRRAPIAAVGGPLGVAFTAASVTTAVCRMFIA